MAREPQDEHLFDMPAKPPSQHPTRKGDKVLYQAPSQRGRNYSRYENIRVRALLQVELERAMAAAGVVVPTPRDWGKARARFAADWVALSLREPGVTTPGSTRGKRPGTHKTDRTKLELWEDAAKTPLRQLLEGTDIAEWLLVGIEATICHRTGQPLPAGARHYQGRLAS